MKPCYAHCVLAFHVPDDARESDVKQGLLEVLNSQDIWAARCEIEFVDEIEFEDEE